ncbi:hypothetical protein, partial [uncultured Pseudoalteromonas sp.]|uniref:hypothetical protein n=1 Tax=uncultured Pseudoalteromonas sp. TaxID=114053 RepID=UPI0030DC5373
RSRKHGCLLDQNFLMGDPFNRFSPLMMLMGPKYQHSYRRRAVGFLHQWSAANDILPSIDMPLL